MAKHFSYADEVYDIYKIKGNETLKLKEGIKHEEAQAVLVKMLEDYLMKKFPDEKAMNKCSIFACKKELRYQKSLHGINYDFGGYNIVVKSPNPEPIRTRKSKIVDKDGK